jgi:hypothetical protein
MENLLKRKLPDVPSGLPFPVTNLNIKRFVGKDEVGCLVHDLHLPPKVLWLEEERPPHDLNLVLGAASCN